MAVFGQPRHYNRKEGDLICASYAQALNELGYESLKRTSFSSLAPLLPSHLGEIQSRGLYTVGNQWPYTACRFSFPAKVYPGFYSCRRCVRSGQSAGIGGVWGSCILIGYDRRIRGLDEVPCRQYTGQAEQPGQFAASAGSWRPAAGGCQPQRAGAARRQGRWQVVAAFYALNRTGLDRRGVRGQHADAAHLGARKIPSGISGTTSRVRPADSGFVAA